MRTKEHSFVVPAYGCSPHLAECLQSLLDQSVRSEVIVATSTPSDELSSLCGDFGVPLVVHSPSRGIGNDWNQALRQASTRYVTVAHQDDRYYRRFTERTLEALARSKGAVLAFTDYEEFTESGPRDRSRLLQIKRLLLEFAFLGRTEVTSQLAKRNALRFACPIPCPAVTMNADIYRDGFDESFQVNLDWATWLAASRCDGAFVWIREILMGHRIHPSSETSAAILDGRRRAEDLRILTLLWPPLIARQIAKSYAAAYASNETT